MLGSVYKITNVINCKTLSIFKFNFFSIFVIAILNKNIDFNIFKENYTCLQFTLNRKIIHFKDDDGFITMAAMSMHVIFLITVV